MATRDERLLLELAAHPAWTVRMAERTGMPERTVRRGIRGLVKGGYVFSPERGLYRLTDRGREVAPTAGDALQGDPVSPGRSAAGEPGAEPEGGHEDTPREAAESPSDGVGWGAVLVTAVIVVIVVLVLWRVASAARSRP